MNTVIGSFGVLQIHSVRLYHNSLCIGPIKAYNNITLIGQFQWFGLHLASWSYGFNNIGIEHRTLYGWEWPYRSSSFACGYFMDRAPKNSQAAAALLLYRKRNIDSRYFTCLLIDQRGKKDRTRRELGSVCVCVCVGGDRVSFMLLWGCKRGNLW